MRRLPIYFLIDVSESMVGEPIEHVQEGMATIREELLKYPYALETVFVSVVAFAGKAKTLLPLTELSQFSPPKLSIDSGASFSNALNYLMDDMDKSIKKSTPEQKGDSKPFVFLFTAGMPTDDCDTAFERWNEKYRHRTNFIAISLGNNIDKTTLDKITDNVLLLKNTDAESLKIFFSWVMKDIMRTVTSYDYMNPSYSYIALPPDIALLSSSTEVNQTTNNKETFIYGILLIVCGASVMLACRTGLVGLNIYGLGMFFVELGFLLIIIYGLKNNK